MLQELSLAFAKYGYNVELIPLPPGHAWNLTDARIAHMNIFIKAIKRKGRVFGAEMIAVNRSPVSCLLRSETSKEKKIPGKIQHFFQAGSAP